jgi:FAD/FMN-containing dehydrogenase
MRRRTLLKAGLVLPFVPYALAFHRSANAWTGSARGATGVPRAIDATWPATDEWARLRRQVGDRLLKLQSPFAAGAPAAARDEAMAQLGNPFYLGDQPALSQTSGWFGAWTSQPSAYAVAAESTADVVAAVDFARDQRLRLVVKGGGHSYQGTSNAAASLLLWTRHLKQIQLHDDFVGQGCAGKQAPQQAVSLGAGCMWIDAYDAVTTKGGRYVQGGGCTTVGVAGLIQSGGFGSFSKAFGSAASNLVEAEVVTADGKVRIANACTNPDLFWGLKGGGGGSLGIVTRVTLRTFDLPEVFGGVAGRIKAPDDASFRALIAQTVRFYADALCNPHWGEQMAFGDNNTLRISMVFQGLSREQAEATWAPFKDWLAQHPEYQVMQPIGALAMPARHFWDASFFREHAPRLIVDDRRPGAPPAHMVWAGDNDQAGWYIHAYQSVWLPGSLLAADQQARLTEALFDASRHKEVGLHFNKGLFGAPDDARTRARNTATNPQVADAFALAIIGASGNPAFPGMPGAKIDAEQAHKDTDAVGRAAAALHGLGTSLGSYVSESDYFLADWQQAFWGGNYTRLVSVKRRYDPANLFNVHHGVGTDAMHLETKAH